MKSRQQRLMLEQVSRSLGHLQALDQVAVPPQGWIRTIRKAINMSLGQLATRLQKTSPTVNSFEKREQEGTITLKSLRDIAEAMDMKLVYAIIPKDETLEEMVKRKAEEKAHEIVNRSSNTMALEGQENDKDWLENAFIEKRNELQNEMPKFLWD